MIRIAVELDVPNQEMLERVKQIRVPVLGFQVPERKTRSRPPSS